MRPFHSLMLEEFVLVLVLEWTSSIPCLALDGSFEGEPLASQCYETFFQFSPAFVVAKCVLGHRWTNDLWGFFSASPIFVKVYVAGTLLSPDATFESGWSLCFLVVWQILFTCPLTWTFWAFSLSDSVPATTSANEFTSLSKGRAVWHMNLSIWGR